VDSGHYILGPELAAFENEFCRAIGAKKVLGVSSGTDALRLCLEALGVGPGDEVLVPVFTFIATATAVSAVGATPVFVDVDETTLTLDPAAAEAAITSKTRAMIPVHLYGHPADMDALGKLAARRNIKIVEDCAQAHLTTFRGKTVGGFGDASAFSFYPTKNLGALGDAGAVAAKDDAVAAAVAELRNVGRGPNSNYLHSRIGQNCRLDELQAAFLRVKLKGLAQATARRRKSAAQYNKGLAGLPLELPELGGKGTSPSFHLYVIRTDRRDELSAYLREKGIGNGVYYPTPLHLQPAYAFLGHKAGDFPVSERACKRVLALPMSSELTSKEVAAVCAAVRTFFK
jgi:dTDP-4-amino-4,6-dideoxygalactose transaminase